jgi:hypothetical protein
MECNLYNQILDLVPQTSKIEHYKDHKRQTTVINDMVKISYLLREYDDLVTVSFTNMLADKFAITFNIEKGMNIFGYECAVDGLLFYEFNIEDYYNGVFLQPKIEHGNLHDDVLLYEHIFKDKNFIFIDELVVQQPVYLDFRVPWKFKKWLRVDGLCYVDYGPEWKFDKIFKEMIAWTENKKK